MSTGHIQSHIQVSHLSCHIPIHIYVSHLTVAFKCRIVRVTFTCLIRTLFFNHIQCEDPSLPFPPPKLPGHSRETLETVMTRLARLQLGKCLEINRGRTSTVKYLKYFREIYGPECRFIFREHGKGTRIWRVE